MDYKDQIDIIKTKNVSETKLLAKSLARQVIKRENKKALIIALDGDLGAGKTVFAQGFAEELKIKERVLSPTFIIFRKYKINLDNFDYFYHFDLYRIEDIKDLGALEFQEIINNPRNIVLIEWAKKIKEILSKDVVFVNINLVKEKTREISVLGLLHMLIVLE